MSSPSRAPKTPARPRGHRTLQRLRREAGYRSAKDFAQVLGIPASTYARYERQDDGPSMAMPLASAWAIADALGVPIDLVVGRADIDAEAAAPVQERYDALTGRGRDLVDSYLAFVELTETIANRPKAGR